LISGYFGFGNLGDEAILTALVQRLKAEFPQLELVVLSSDPQGTAKHHQVQAINRWNPWAILRELKNTDIFISGGGGLLQDVTSKRSLLYYLSLIALAQRFKKPVFLVGQGIGPLVSFFSKKLTPRILQQAEYILVRDEQSFSLLESLGINEEQLGLGADLLFSLKVEVKKSNWGIGPKKRKVLGVSLKQIKKAKRQRFIKVMAQALDEASQHLDLLVIFIPMYPKEDLKIMETVAEEMKQDSLVLNTSGLKVMELLNIIKEFELLLGTRLHSLEFALQAGVPFMALSYDPKVDSFIAKLEEITNLRIPLWDINEIDEGKLISGLEELWQKRELYKQGLRRGALLFSEVATRGLDDVCQRIAQSLANK